MLEHNLKVEIPVFSDLFYQSLFDVYGFVLFLPLPVGVVFTASFVVTVDVIVAVGVIIAVAVFPVVAVGLVLSL